MPFGCVPAGPIKPMVVSVPTKTQARNQSLLRSLLWVSVVMEDPISLTPLQWEMVLAMHNKEQEVSHSDALLILARLAASMLVQVEAVAAPVEVEAAVVAAAEEAPVSNRTLDAEEDVDAVAEEVAVEATAAVEDAAVVEVASAVVETVFAVLIETTVLTLAVEVTHAAAPHS